MEVRDIKQRMREAEDKIVSAISALETNDIKFLSLEIEKIEITTKDSPRRTFMYKANIKTELISDED